MLPGFDCGNADEPSMTEEFSDLNPNEAAVCRILKSGEASFDGLCSLLSIDPGMLSATLTKLELKLIIVQDANKIYRLTK